MGQKLHLLRGVASAMKKVCSSAACGRRMRCSNIYTSPNAVRARASSDTLAPVASAKKIFSALDFDAVNITASLSGKHARMRPWSLTSFSSTSIPACC